MLKSALKKPSLEQTCNGRRVTFSKTLKVYSSCSSLSKKLDHELNYELVDLDELDISVLAKEEHVLNDNCILSWQDFCHKDYDVDVCDDRQAENPEDFFVHKVVYDAAELDSQEGNSEYFVPESDSDCQDFVVHHVVRSESDVDREASEAESDTDVVDKNVVDDKANETKKIVELSVENIEQHNKLLGTDLVSDNDCSQDLCPSLLMPTELLSPPLQELGIERLICPQADKWFWDLDISPLNSVQETDSDSNLSSEDTMIMMTSAECEKNEKHIQESFEKFQSLKKLSDLINEASSNASEYESGSGGPEGFSLLSTTTSAECTHLSCANNVSSVSTPEETCETLATDTSFNNPSSTGFVSTNSISSEESVGAEESLLLDSSSYDCVNRNSASCCASRHDSVVSSDNPLSFVEIPRDVREWKIDIAKSESQEENNYAISRLNDSQPYMHPRIHESAVDVSPLDSGNRPDELERFVDQCTERVERIRKRYSISEKSLWSPNRGIRPRFKSTAEILQQMQDGQHMGFPNNHYSWPYYVAFGPESAACYLDENSSRSSLQEKDFHRFPSEMVYSTRSVRLRLFDTESSSVQNIPCNEHSLNNCDFAMGASRSPTSLLLTFHERGVPEGASPPRLSSESLCDSDKNVHPLSVSDSIIYYSMKV